MTEFNQLWTIANVSSHVSVCATPTDSLHISPELEIIVIACYSSIWKNDGSFDRLKGTCQLKTLDYWLFYWSEDFKSFSDFHSRREVLGVGR